MTEEINVDWKALYEQVVGENEALKEKLVNFKLSRFHFDTLIEVAKMAMNSGWFWLGFFIAIVAMWLIGSFRFLKEVS